MQTIEIWPNGEIDLGSLQIGDETFYVVQMRHQKAEPVLNIMMSRATFVHVADHLKMAADAIVNGDF